MLKTKRYRGDGACWRGCRTAVSPNRGLAVRASWHYAKLARAHSPVLPRLQVRGYACDCAFPGDCDSQLQHLPPTRVQAARGAPAAPLAERPGGGPAKAHLAPAAHPAASAVAGGGGHARQNGQTAEQQLQGLQASAPAGQDGSAEVRCQQLEDRFVNDVYNTIAPHFNATRWPPTSPPCAFTPDVANSLLRFGSPVRLTT